MELSRQLRLSLSRAQRVEPDRKYTIVSEPSQTNLSKGRLNLFPFISVAVLLGSFFYLFSEYRTGTVVLVPSWIKEKAWRAVTALQQYVQVSKEDEENENTEWTLCTLRQRR